MYDVGWGERRRKIERDRERERDKMSRKMFPAVLLGVL